MTQAQMHTSTSVGMQVDPRRNGLNTVRLVLAASVLVWHSFRLTGREVPYPHGGIFFGSFGVDGFFVISGLLLSGSYLHRPDLWVFLRNRALRILPGFWVCLVVVAFGFAPLALLIQGGAFSGLMHGSDPAWRYVLVNIATRMQQWSVANTPAHTHYDGYWDGSLWTLSWEMIAYLCLAALGVVGLLRRRVAMIVATAGLWALHIADTYELIPHNYWVSTGSRLGLMFALGVLLHLFGPKIPRTALLTVIAAVVLAVSTLLPTYSVLGAPALAYLVVTVGIALSAPRWWLRDRDISYGLYIYTFPVQQTLVLLGAAVLPVPLFALLSLVSAVPFAAASWFGIERPALGLKRRNRQKSVAAQPG
jgi:peptidoglycan/LPS O-acetylase OafA/YrhL